MTSRSKRIAAIRWTRFALEDLEHIRIYLSEHADADTMQSEALRIWQATQRLLSFPESGRPGRVPLTRELVVSPYIIPYRIIDDAVQILNVFHSTRQW